MAGIFKRVEKKYLLTAAQSEALIERLGERAADDPYTDYTIQNIYYDTRDNDLIRTSLMKPPYKEKMRLRSYGTPGEEDVVFLELKKKWQGIVYKRRVELPLKVARDYLEKGIYPKEYDCQILKELDYAIKFYDLRPGLFLAYDRKAWFLREDPGIRFTIDSNIRSRRSDMDLALGDRGRKLFCDDRKLLEVKAPNALPLWFIAIMDELEIRPVSFSKYGRIYEDNLRWSLSHLPERGQVTVPVPEPQYAEAFA